MVRVITQETFNEAVRENVDLLGMSYEEALEETIKQFQAQSVDLSNISREVMKSTIDDTSISNAIKELERCNNDKKKPEEIDECLKILKEECDKGIEYRVIAGKKGAYGSLLTCIRNNEGNTEFEKTVFKTMLSLMTKQPDLLNNEGADIILKYLEVNQDSDIKKLCLKWAKECCVLHENNRQKLYDLNVLCKVKQFLEDDDVDVLKEVLSLFRALVLDDDVRVEFGKAHEHARGIASETLLPLTKLLSKFKGNAILVNDLILTVSSLLVRTEFCKQFSDAGGLDLIKEVMQQHERNEKINRQCFKLLKALAGNDDCKAQIITKGLAPHIISALNNNIKSVSVATAGLSCIAALSLRSPENSKVLFENNTPEVLVQVMKNYPKEKLIQKTGSWAVRNMVSRSKHQCPHFIELGIEDILLEALKNFKECEYDIKSALRDLGCEIELKEEWTGKGGLLNHLK